MYRIKVYLDSLMTSEPLPAWTDGQTWNGWTVPYFEPAAAGRLLQLYQQANGKGSAWYDADTDEYCFYVEGDPQPERYGASTQEAGNQVSKLYPIGAGAWIWDEWEPLN